MRNQFSDFNPGAILRAVLPDSELTLCSYIEVLIPPPMPGASSVLGCGILGLMVLGSDNY